MNARSALRAVCPLSVLLALGCGEAHKANSKLPPPPAISVAAHRGGPGAPTADPPPGTPPTPSTPAKPSPSGASTAPSATANCPGRDLPLTEKVDWHGQSSVPVLDLGDGLELEFLLHSTHVRRGSQHELGPAIPFAKNPYDMTPSIKRVRQCADGTLLLIYDCSADPVRTTRAELLARLENGPAMRLYRKGQFAAAAEGFRRALTTAPEFDVAATNLASALTRLGRKREAVAAVQPLFARAELRTYAKLCQDPDLRPLLEEPEVVAHRAPRPGNARTAISGVYYSEAKRAVASVNPGRNADDCFDPFLMVRGLGGERLLEMVAGSPCGSRKERAVKAVGPDRFLADLGFDVYESGEQGERTESRAGGHHHAWRFPRGRFAVVFADVMRVIRKDTILQEASYNMDGDTVDGALWMPSAQVIAYSWHTMYTHEENAGFDVAPLPASALDPLPVR